jgi:hypothetical protein
MRRSISGGLGVLSLALVGCGAPAVRSAAAVAPAPAPFICVLPLPVRERLDHALEAMSRHDAAHDWSPEACKETAAKLHDLRLEAPGAAAPIYDEALVAERCGRRGEAKALYEAAVLADKTFWPARTALALIDAESGPAGLDRAIAALHDVVVESRFSDVAAHTALGMLEERRGNAVADAEGPTDRARARRSFQRALAIDDRYLPALNQLALSYLAAAREAAPKIGARRDTQALELAALVCSQAIRKDPRFAPIHNTAGLVEIELGDLSRAAASFGEARRLDPGFFEAQMNYAAVNLSFRGFAEAEQAYRAALQTRPDDYDAHLGLSLALRGQIDEANEQKLVPMAEDELGRAEKLSPDRPEAYYNQAILTQEYRGKWGEEPQRRAARERAKELFGTFLKKADDAPALADARKKAAERIQEIDQIGIFIGEVQAQPLPAPEDP